MKDARRRRWSVLLLIALVCALVPFAISAAALEPGCKTSACTYYPSEGGSLVGHCGVWDTSCGCFASVGGGGQQQAACNSDAMD